MLLVVAPLVQAYVEPLLAVNVTVEPGQKLVAPDAVIVAVGKVLTFTAVMDEVETHPVAYVT
jgi:hypothetical protein